MKRKETYFINKKEVTFDEWIETVKKLDFIGEVSAKFEEEDTIESLRATVDKLTKEIEELKKRKTNDGTDWWEINKPIPTTIKSPYYPYITWDNKNFPTLFKITCDPTKNYTTCSTQN